MGTQYQPVCGLSVHLRYSSLSVMLINDSSPLLKGRTSGHPSPEFRFPNRAVVFFWMGT
jgi:hypothetical protein